MNTINLITLILILILNLRLTLTLTLTLTRILIFPDLNPSPNLALTVGARLQN